MTDSDTKDKPESAAKFLFDLHNFDVPDEPEEEEDLPPPPTFYQEDIEKAMKDGYQQGKLDGVVEAEGKREEFVATLLETISKETPSLFHNEKIRYDTFEKEVILLSKALFEAALPSLTDTFATYEIEKLIRNVLETHQDVPEIIIEVHPDYKEDIEKHVNESINPRFQNGKISIEPNPAIEEHNCFVKWANGGAYRDINVIIQDITTNLKDVIQAAGCDELLKHYDASAATETPPAGETGQNTELAEASPCAASPAPAPETVDTTSPPSCAAAPELPSEADTPDTTASTEAVPSQSPQIEKDKEVDLSDNIAHNQESAVTSGTDKIPEEGTAANSADITPTDDAALSQKTPDDISTTEQNTTEVADAPSKDTKNIADATADQGADDATPEPNVTKNDDGDTP